MKKAEIKKKPLVYIASPYTGGNQALNVRFQQRALVKLIESGFTPYAPLLLHYVEMMDPQPYEFWLTTDLEMLLHADVVLALNAKDPQVDYMQIESSGRDREVKFARKNGIPVVTSFGELYEWYHRRTAHE
jgi:nucleoside 2-deoxyribosyltransferase